jgi:glycosyltransferase involved in cell wall biosynthesis
MKPTWIVMIENDYRRWGGDMRRGNLFRALADRTGAGTVNGFSARKLRRFVGWGPWLFPAPLPFLARSGPLPRLASSEQLRPDMVMLASRVADLTAVAIYDDPIAQTAALGIQMPSGRARYLRLRRSANIDAFRWLVVPSRSFAELARLDLNRVITGGNGTDTNHIRPQPWPDLPTVGMASGAAPGRGIEALIEAATLAREQVPELRLNLWLVATGAKSEAYLESLTNRFRREAWIEIGSAPYRDLGAALGTASVLVVPHPPNDYLDVALPVKLFDSMAAGRPLVVTPRLETRAIVERHEAGVVTADDSVDALAEAVLELLDDPGRMQRMGAAARQAAERHYAWPVVGGRIAEEILSREGPSDA